MKDCRRLASIAIPYIDEAEAVILNMHELYMANMKRSDYLARIKLHGESFILHMEFESNLRSNLDMQRRMLRYYSSLYWNEDLPILQALVILKETNIRNISSGTQSRVLDEDVLKHQYRLIKLYEMDKYPILSTNIKALFPLRVFMRNEGEQPVEQIKECLHAAETRRS